MVTYIQKTNRNSFTLRYKKYKRYRSDLWGRIAFANKNNSFTTQMKKYAYQDLKNLTRTMSKRKRRRVFRTFRLTKGFYEPFEYSVTSKPEPKQRKRLSSRSELIMLRKKVSAYYYLRLKRKSLRKLFKRRMLQRLYNTPLESKTIHPTKFLTSAYIHGSTGSTLEARFDVILYRLNLIQSIYDGRRFIRTKKAFVLSPCTRNRIYRKFFIFSSLRKHYHKVPIFYFVSLRADLSLFRKIILRNLIYGVKLLAYPPNYLLVNYKTMIGLRIHSPAVIHVRYPFKGTLAFFMGTALYF